MPDLSVAVFLANSLGERFVATVAYERRGYRVRDLRREKNVTGTCRGNLDYLVEEDYKIGEPSLDAEIVKYMSHSIANFLFH